MHVFELDASDLNGVLGMLTATSQRYNVTLEDLFTGLDRSAATAKQARVSLAELQALLAVMVGRTGQTGIIVGNTLKNIFTQFNNPTIQRYLRQQYGVETMVTACWCRSSLLILPAGIPWAIAASGFTGASGCGRTRREALARTETTLFQALSMF